MFGGLQLSVDGAELPSQIAHIARDPLTRASTLRRWPGGCALRSTVKRALLDQTLVSGIGNIYADETLWRCRVHYDQPTATSASVGPPNCSALPVR